MSFCYDEDMTELLYMKDFDVEACEAKVVSCAKSENSRMDLVLDQTCFYARGGGQDWDQGLIKTDKASFNVDEVHLDEDGVVHHIGSSSGNLLVDDTVSCEVDHKRRSINSRLHSAAHVIDMAVDQLELSWTPGKGQHYPHLSAIEYSGELDSEESDKLSKQIETRANELIEKGSINMLRFMSVDEMHTVCRNVPDNLPKNKPARVVMYGDFGIPCGGTHLKNIKDVGKVIVKKLKNKRGVIRLSYAVEGINS